MKIDRKYAFWLLLVIFLFTCRKIICDLFYLDQAETFEAVYGPDAPNPFNVAWNLLRDKFISSERLIFLSCVILWFKPFSLSAWVEYLKNPEERWTVRLLIVYWQFAVGDFIDRVFFNTHEFSWNDWLILVIGGIYIINTLKYVGRGSKAA